MQKFNLEWKKGMSFEGVTPSNHKIVLDASEEVGGKNSGPRPMENFKYCSAAATLKKSGAKINYSYLIEKE